ncbi:MAG: amidohydrolase family protein, partial [candidate division Zixibacteria bacterium]|nr:amidohydrolase family protein [candidate division Zixibacteria bacterium]
FWAWSLGHIDLSECWSYDETLRTIRKSMRRLKRGEWLVGRGWFRDGWENPAWPHKKDLDKIAPNHPAVMMNRDQHAIWVNSKALKMAGITADTPDPKGGEIVRDPSGEPTGILKDTAAQPVYKRMKSPTGKRAMELLKNAVDHAHALGITGVASFDSIDGFKKVQEFHRKYGLGLRLNQYIPSAHLNDLLSLGIQSGLGDRFLRIAGVKYFADGALGSQTALMFKPYKGSKSNYGLEIYDQDELNAEIKKCNKAGLNVAIHAIGDRANNIALNAIIKAQGRSVRRFRNRIEHCQLLMKEDIERFGKNNIVGSVQPVQMPLDIDMIEKYWGRRGRYSYALKSLLDNGTTLAFGSDAPIEPPNPLLNIYLAVSRHPRNFSKPFYSSEKISIEQALFAQTYGGAFSVEQEMLYGSIKIGHFADIVILDKDLHCVAPDQIPDLEVLGTLLEGEFVYGKDRFNNW